MKFSYIKYIKGVKTYEKGIYVICFIGLIIVKSFSTYIDNLKIAIVILLLSLNFRSNCQTHLSNGNKLNINLSTIFYQPYQLKSFGYNSLRNVVTPTFQAGFGYSRFLKKNWSYDLNLQYSLIGYRTRWYELTNPFVNDEFIYPIIIEHLQYKDHRFTIGNGISKAFHLNNDFYLQTSYMFDINLLILSGDFISKSILFDENENILGESYFSMVRPNVKDLDFSISHSFKLGILKEHKKYSYSIKFVYNLAPKILGFGTYKLDTPDFKGGGVLYKRSSYFGLEYNFYFNIK